MQAIQKRLETCFKTYQQYEDLMDSYVSDYYLENHWKKLPKTWQEDLADVSVDHLTELLDFTKPMVTKVYPLSLLSLRMVIISNIIPRVRQNTILKYRNDESFTNLFWKNVKLKKRHEISIMAELCHERAIKTNCFYIVDIGSGLGHLSRLLSFGYGLKVCTFEADVSLWARAQDLDYNLEKMLSKKKIYHKKSFDTVHINQRITPDLSEEAFLKLVRNAFNNYSECFNFGIIGLHPCGNLGSTLLRLYVRCPNAKFMNMASCCYMKLIMEPSLNSGFPISNFCRKENFKLTYLSCEIACHAIENYVEKLKNTEDYFKLKIHAYRAVLETLLVSLKPELKHSMICSVKYHRNLNLRTYCKKALEHFDISLSEDVISLYDSLINKTWQNVVIFYSIRLLLAPLVESIILLDRLLYAEESGSYCEIIPVFSCNISPRNLVLFARKS